ncbi:DNA phosphorothioation-dependent restriction protein DptH [Endozoicomonas atrinae]|uniref:DNA phosphorothioation-dependent restriction protein DptH n=1 Tax=Endozoicomonas atrinae TaxID=1333660 RepID=UPI0008257D5F|nr:DNA phosphorothioation-dependent restriction protein DptH [Endozoicomonas atrinae]
MCAALFEQFLTNRLTLWLESKITPGSRYQFQSPDAKNTQSLFNALKSKADDFILLEDTQLPYIQINGIRLIFVAHADSNQKLASRFSENYISMLRDTIAGQSAPLEGCALLVLHNSLLDTLINSAEDLASPGSVWAPKTVETNLVDYADSQITGQRLIKNLLAWQTSLIHEEGGSMFGFEPLFKTISTGGTPDLRNLGLLPDAAISTGNWSDKQIIKRLEDNRRLKQEIADVIEHFPEEVSERLPDLGDKFIKENITRQGADFTTVDIENYWNEMDEQKQFALAFHSLEVDDSCKLTGPRNASSTAAGKRKKHLIIEAPRGTSEVKIKVVFHGSDIKREQFDITDNDDLEKLPLKGTTGKGKYHLSCDIPWNGSPTFLTLRLTRTKNSERHSFHILILEEGTFHVEAFANKFLVNPKKKHKCIVLQTDEHELVINPELSDKKLLSDNEDSISCDEYGVINYQEPYEQSEVVLFDVTSGLSSLTFQIEGEVSTDSLTLPLLLDENRFNRLFNDHYNGQFIPAKSKVILDNQENKTVGPRQKLLELEHRLVSERILFLSATGHSDLTSDDISRIAPDFASAASELLDYLKSRQTLVSLCSWGKEFRDRAKAYVTTYLEYLESIPLDRSLNSDARTLLKVGFVEQENRELISPLHPLIVAYYLNLTESILSDGDVHSFGNLPPITRKRLNPRGLLPYVFSLRYDYCYTQVLDENSFWLDIVPQQQTSYQFVGKLVKEKIEEFTKTFRELFQQVNSAPLIINSINNGENIEFFQGLISYYRSHLLNSHCIHINLYDDDLTETEFDRFAEMGSYDQIKQVYRLDKGSARENADTIIDLLRTRLSFSKFRHDDKAQAYAHLSFFKNNQKIDCVDKDSEQHISGQACDGLLNGESSRSEHGSYYTAFGLENTDWQSQPHLRLALLINRLFKPARQSNTLYTKNSAIALAVSDEFRAALDRSYDSSIWTTVIDPKVTLDFFHSSQNLILIHYSDQYTSSAGYDAITVTRQTELYRKILNQRGNNLLSEYNAFNGEWLLKTVTDQPTEHKGKRGIIGSWKLVSALLAQSDITWIPLSVAEMIRVSGNVGLKMSESDFSRYHQGNQFSGKISDDILFAGFRDGELILLPVEVKTGHYGTGHTALEGARTQAKALGKYMVEGLLAPRTLEGRLYRGLFMRQILMQIEKYQLYQVFNHNYFNSLLAQRELWLKGDYQLATLPGYPAGLVVVHREDDNCTRTTAQVIDNILQLEMPYAYLDTLVGSPLAELQSLLANTNQLGIPASAFMSLGLVSQRVIPLTNEVLHIEDNEEFEDESTELDQHELFDELSRALEADLGADNTDTPISGANQETVHTDQTQSSGNTLASVEPKATEEQQPFANEEPLRVLFGTELVTELPIYWEPTNTDKLFNPNTAIIGTMGTGKTQFTKSLITQLVRNQAQNVDGQPIGILIFDYKADYIKDDFVQATNAKVFNLFNLPFNPLALFGNKPMLPVHTANLFRNTLATAYNLGNKQKNKISTLILEAYDKAGIKPQDPSTWSKPTPTVQQIWELFMEQEKVEEDSLYAALFELISFQIFQPDPNETQSLYDLVDGVTVINLSGYSTQIQSLIVAITLDIFYNQMHLQGSSKFEAPYRQISKFILVDEADNFMKQDFASLRMIMKEGREFGVGTILSTQELSHFKTSENNYASYVLSWVVHKVNEIKAQDVRTVFKTNSKADDDKVIEQIQGLEKHTSLYLGGQDRVRTIKDKAFWELIQK